MVAFLIFPTRTNNFNVETLRGQAVVKSLRDTIHEIQQKIGKRIYDVCLRYHFIHTFHDFVSKSFFFSFYFSGRLPESEELLQKEDTVRLKRCIYAAQRNTLPPITTHNVVDDNLDPVLNSFRRCKLFNEKNDRVKVCLFLCIQKLALFFFYVFNFY